MVIPEGTLGTEQGGVVFKTVDLTGVLDVRGFPKDLAAVRAGKAIRVEAL